MSKTKVVDLSLEMRSAIEQLLKVANAEKYYAVGILFREDSIAVIRNCNDDLPEAFRAAADLVSDRLDRGLIIDGHVKPAN